MAGGVSSSGSTSPVDLVGHDWGGIHVVNVAMTRPELHPQLGHGRHQGLPPGRRLASAGGDLAEAGRGRGVDRAASRRPVPLAELLTARGMASEVVDEIAAGFDATMGECILRLYRAAAQPEMARLGMRLEAAAARPGLVFRRARRRRRDRGAATRGRGPRGGGGGGAAGGRALVADGEPDQTRAAEALTRPGDEGSSAADTQRVTSARTAARSMLDGSSCHCSPMPRSCPTTATATAAASTPGRSSPSGTPSAIASAT